MQTTQDWGPEKVWWFVSRCVVLASKLYYNLTPVISLTDKNTAIVN